ncbi:MAG TPA: sigma-54 dependent transcriptional regulator [Vicinamibacterales bacterium]|nr:sigma-54 dependent transcriptional regulator [Vicinamibacterales bacterium]
MAVVLVVDDEQAVLDSVCNSLRRRSHRPVASATAERAIDLARRIAPELAVVDLRLAGPMDGMALFKVLKTEQPSLLGIMVTGFASFRTAFECGQGGFADYLAKPFSPEDLLTSVDGVLSMYRRPTHPPADSQSAEFDGMVGRSPSMLALFDRILRVAPLDEPVLILGETGTGKELVARSIHRRSKRSAGPFIAVNCAAIPGPLFESEFFGHERGAFTDAKEAKPGRFEQAHRGTLFLDEVADLSLDAQAKLLRVMDGGEIARLGARRQIVVDVRVLAATNAPLADVVERGAFRRDLYWRLDGMSIAVPPLRERTGDLRLLAGHFFPQLAKSSSATARFLSSGALQELEQRAWSGNVRELQHVLREVVLSCPRLTVEAGDLPASDTRRISATTGDASVTDGLSLQAAVEQTRAEVERRMIREALARYGSVRKTAEALGIDPKTLYEKRLRYGL